MDFSHFVGFPAVKEYSLRNSGLAGIDMGNDADIADSFEGWMDHENLSRRDRKVKRHTQRDFARLYAKIKFLQEFLRG
jgi:hypothetical protein